MLAPLSAAMRDAESALLGAARAPGVTTRLALPRRLLFPGHGLLLSLRRGRLLLMGSPVAQTNAGIRGGNVRGERVHVSASQYSEIA
jgi:hypothetical protein